MSRRLAHLSPSAPVYLSGDGLTLREWTVPDVVALPALFDEEQIDLWTPLASPFDLAAAEAYVQGAARAKQQSAGIQLAITVGTGSPAGEILLFGCDGDPDAGEVAYAVGSAYRGNNYAARALALLVPWATRVLRLRTLRLLIADENAPSRRVAVRSQFSRLEVPAVVRRRKGREVVLSTWERPAGAAGPPGLAGAQAPWPMSSGQSVPAVR